MQVFVVVAIWYGLGAIAAVWAIRQGHNFLVWTTLAAILGGMALLLVVTARLWVRLRTRDRSETASWSEGRDPSFAGPSFAGPTVSVIVGVDEDPGMVIAYLRHRCRALAAADVLILVSEEANIGCVDTGEADRSRRLAEAVGSRCPVPISTRTISESGFGSSTPVAGPLAILSPGAVERPFRGSAQRQARAWAQRLGVAVDVIGCDSDQAPHLPELLRGRDRAVTA